MWTKVLPKKQRSAYNIKGTEPERGMKRLQEETRKGPWTEQEDLQLTGFVSLFGERRWDFIAKVSGLNRTGKSCRLRWVNYLQPGLKRGKITPQEEKLILELHSRWGNRWSRIARKLPGRTDNEIKNYWRTHTRKKAQEQKRATSTSSSTSNCCSSSNNPTIDLELDIHITERILQDSEGPGVSALTERESEEEGAKGYFMDQIRKEFASLEGEIGGSSGYEEEGCNFSGPPMASPLWDYCLDSLWMMDEEIKIWESILTG